MNTTRELNKIRTKLNRNLNRDMHRLMNLKEAYDKAENPEFKSVHRGQWYALVAKIAKDIEKLKIIDH